MGASTALPVDSEMMVAFFHMGCFSRDRKGSLLCLLSEPASNSVGLPNTSFSKKALPDWTKRLSLPALATAAFLQPALKTSHTQVTVRMNCLYIINKV